MRNYPIPPKRHIMELRGPLVTAIRTTIEDNADELTLPWIGDESFEIMAEAVLIVLRGMRDTEKYMVENGIVKDVYQR